MHLKKFVYLYVFLLGLGMLALSFKDLIFVSQAESQLAKVTHHVEGKTETYHKMTGTYEEKTLAPAISYSVDGKEYTYIADYSCKDGCQKVGSDVTIFYKKDKPTDVLVASFGGMWKYKIYFLIAMAVLLLTALPYLYVNKRRES